MHRVEDAKLPEGRWWSAEVRAPLDAVVLDFVALFYEHFDNNDGANHHAIVAFDPQLAKCALHCKMPCCGRSRLSFSHDA